MTKKDYDINLDAVCEKLETVTRKVWDEDRVSAVALQAVSNEIIAGLRRAEEIVSSLHQELQNRESVLNREWEAKASALEEKTDAALAKALALEDELFKAKAKIASLMRDLEAKEEENGLFQEKCLKAEAQKTAERAAHMEKFIEEQGEKEKEREEFWKQRHQALESDFKRREQEFEKRQRDLLEEMQRSAEDTRKLQLQKEMELMDAQKQLQAEFQVREKAQREKEREYARKYEELEKLKQNMRAEIAELTRQHQKGGTENK